LQRHCAAVALILSERRAIQLKGGSGVDLLRG
jgi:hypothetical protein